MSEQKIIAKVNIRLCQRHMLELLKRFPRVNLNQVRDPCTCDICISSKNIKEPWREAIVQARVSVEVVSV